MAKITFKGNEVNTAGNLSEVGSQAPNFTLTGSNLAPISLSDFAGKNLILNIFPSIDTGICAASVRQFNKEISSLPNTVVLCVSKDLPFAHNRFCAAEGIENVQTASDFKNPEFNEAYAVLMTDGPLAGLMSRAIVAIDAQGKVIYTEQVPEIAQEPDYKKVQEALS